MKRRIGFAVHFSLIALVVAWWAARFRDGTAREPLDTTLYAMLLGTPRETEICIRDLRVAPAAQVRLLGGDSRLDWRQDGADLIVRLASPLAMASHTVSQFHHRRDRARRCGDPVAQASAWGASRQSG